MKEVKRKNYRSNEENRNGNEEKTKIRKERHEEKGQGRKRRWEKDRIIIKQRLRKGYKERNKSRGN
jgi:hypothetical protein